MKPVLDTILIGFNSQRDGILLVILHSYYFSSTLVSIPNGMEFYRFCFAHARQMPTVSIPNGMEFYRNEFLHLCNTHLSFNSQRDGILLRLSSI